MKLKNYEILEYLNSLESFLERNDIIGYAAARNTRYLRNCATEYEQIHNDLIVKYGSPELDDDGNETGRSFIDMKDPSFKQFKMELTTFSNIEHEVTIFKIPYSEVIGKLTGSEILEIDWMFEDSDTPQDC